MRKVLLLASMLAMAVLAVSPALAQSGGQNASSQLCQNVVGDVNVEGGDNVSASQYQYGDVAQENNTSVAIVQSCLQQAEQNAGGGDTGGDAPAGSDAPTGDDAASSGAPSGAAQSGGQNVSQQVCQNIIGDVNVQGGDNVSASQYQYGDVAQENNTSVAIVQECLQQVNQNAGGGDTGGGTPPEDPAPEDPAPEQPAPGDDQYEAPAPGDGGDMTDPGMQPAPGDAPAPGEEIVLEEGDEVFVQGDKIVIEEVFVDADATIIVGEGGKEVVVERTFVEAGDTVVVPAPEAATPEAATPVEEAPVATAPAAEAEFVPADNEGQPVEVLPDTGGASLITLGLGALLIAGGLIARKIVRA